MKVMAKPQKPKLTRKGNKKAKGEEETKGRKIVKVRDEDDMDNIIKEHMQQVSMKKTLGMLKQIGGETLNPCTREEQVWKKLSFAADSGACENVIDAEEEVPNDPDHGKPSFQDGCKLCLRNGRRDFEPRGGSSADDDGRRDEAAHEAASR